MALAVTFAELITAVRDEARISTANSTNSDHLAYIKRLINRYYVTLAEEWDWEHLQLTKGTTASQIAVSAGTFTYALPTAINQGKIDKAWYKQNTLGEAGVWVELTYGIHFDHYSVLDPTASTPQTAVPVTHWDFHGTGSFDVWPQPSALGVVAFEGQRSVGAMTTTSDTCSLDDQLVILFTSAEILASNDQKEAAQVKAGMAQRRLSQQIWNRGNRERFRIGMGDNRTYRREFPRQIKWVR